VATFIASRKHRRRRKPRKLACDKGYSVQRIRDWLKAQGIEAVIPHKDNEHARHDPDVTFDKQTYRQRAVVEQCVGSGRWSSSVSATGACCFNLKGLDWWYTASSTVRKRMNERKLMTKLRSQLWTNEKGKRFVVLPEEDFLRMSELVEDRGLSRILREAVASDTNEPSIPFSEVKRQLATDRGATTKKRRT